MKRIKADPVNITEWCNSRNVLIITTCIRITVEMNQCIINILRSRLKKTKEKETGFDYCQIKQIEKSI